MVGEGGTMVGEVGTTVGEGGAMAGEGCMTVGEGGVMGTGKVNGGTSTRTAGGANTDRTDGSKASEMAGDCDRDGGDEDTGVKGMFEDDPAVKEGGVGVEVVLVS